MDRSTALKILGGSPLLGVASEDELRKLLAVCTLRSLTAGSPLFLQGQPATLLYLVIEGEILVSSSSAEGETLIHRRIGPGEVIGEIAILDGGPRTATGVACGDCTVLAVDRRTFLQFMEGNPKVAIRLAEILARRIRTTSDSLESSIFLSAPQRIGKKLVELARARGRPSELGCIIDDLTHEALSRMVGLHRVSVSNNLKSFERMGLLKIQRGSVVILQLDQLDGLCSEGSSC